MINTDTVPNTQTSDEVTSYQEVQVGRTLYRVTSVYEGKIDLGRTLEDLTIKKVLQTASPILDTRT